MINKIDSAFSTITNNKIIFSVISFFLICIVLALFFSAANSGYNYVLDNDEIHHTQVSYLLLQGYKPFTEVYLTVYPPYFNWLIAPIFQIQGFSFETISTIRLFMISLFGIRIVLLGLIAYLLFSKRVAVLTILFFLCSSFVMFAEMQIRPDNLMITVFLLGVLAGIWAWKKQQILFDVLSSFLLMFSVLLLLKILPAVLFFFLLSLAICIKQKKWNKIAALFSGSLLAILVFIFPFLLNGTFLEMIQQVFVESLSSYSGVFEFPVPLGFFYRPDNPALFGLPGKPITWIFSWILLLSSAMGMFHLYEKIHNQTRTDQWKQIWYIFLTCAYIGQFGFLFLAESVFIQHYITLNWLFALGSAVAISQILKQTETYPFGKIISAGILIVGLFPLVTTTLAGNTNRATITSEQVIRYHNNLWSYIPENEPSFPNILFRPLGYPVPAGHFIGNMPPEILSRLPSIPASLEKTQTKYVYIDQYYFDRIPMDARKYIEEQFITSSIDPNLYIKQ